MNRYGTFDAEGRPTGFYSDDVHTPKQIPAAAREISEEDYQAFSGGQGKWRWVNGFRQPAPPPPPIPLETSRSLKEQEIRQGGSARLKAIVAPYSYEERESWHKQEKEARDYFDNDTTPTPMLSAMATARGIPVESMVSKVLENVTAFESAAGTILGQQQALLDALDASQTLAEIKNVGWPE